MLENDENSLMVDDGEYECGNSTDDVTADRAEEFNRRYETSPTTASEQPANKWALRDRLRSKVLWTTLVGVLMDVFTAFDVWDMIGITSVKFKAIVTAIGTILAVFGIFNDPTNREGF